MGTDWVVFQGNVPVRHFHDDEMDKALQLAFTVGGEVKYQSSKWVERNATQFGQVFSREAKTPIEMVTLSGPQGTWQLTRAAWEAQKQRSAYIQDLFAAQSKGQVDAYNQMLAQSSDVLGFRVNSIETLNEQKIGEVLDTIESFEIIGDVVAIARRPGDGTSYLGLLPLVSYLKFAGKIDDAVKANRARRATSATSTLAEGSRVSKNADDIAWRLENLRRVKQSRKFVDLPDFLQNVAPPGNKGLIVPRRLTPEEMVSLTSKFEAEVSLIYKAGLGKNGGGGTYLLYSGSIKHAPVPIGQEYRLIFHTHPGGTAFRSTGDLNVLKQLEEAGSPQRASGIIPFEDGPARVVPFGESYNFGGANWKP